MAGSVFTREDTFFGVCFALGADFGFNPTWLRVAFAFLFFWSPAVAAAVYSALGILVAVSRWLVPEPADLAAEPEERFAEPAPAAAADLPLAA